MSNKLYLECATGIAGDMAVASMLDLGASREGLFHTLEELHLTGYKASVESFLNNAIMTTRFSVALEDPSHPDLPGVSNFDPRDDEESNTLEHVHDHEHSHDHEHFHDHDHEHIHDHDHHHDHDHEHPHDHDHEHIHDHDHHHDHDHEHSHDHIHRNLKDIEEILNRLSSDRIRSLALDIFRIVATAEASVHGKSIDEVHFHEVGAVDSIVDIVSAAYCLTDLDIDEIFLRSVNEGYGTIHCAHGDLPVPVPAVLAIAGTHHLPMKFIDVEGELVTPTGAAIAAVLWKGRSLPEQFTVLKTGYASGHRKYKSYSLLRAMLIDENQAMSVDKNPENSIEESTSPLCRLETNIDDSTGESLGFVMELLLENGARDVFYTPIYMKKNRPAYMLTVLCNASDVAVMENIIFRHTTTIGIRKSPVERDCLSRIKDSVETQYGTAEVKICTWNDEKYIYPEYESVRRICASSGMTFQEAQSFVIDAYKK